MKVVVCGSRDWSDGDKIMDVLMELPARSTVIHGGCRGADVIAGEVAQGLGHTVQVVRARWDLYGKSAGYKRNQAMVDMGPDRVIAFSNGSRGTQHTINLARQRGIQVQVYGKEYADDDGF